MFQLDDAVDRWCDALHHKYRLTNKEIDELRDHLQCDIEQRLKAGADEEEAFTAARENIGEPRDISGELIKVSYFDRVLRLPAGLIIFAVLVVWAGSTMLFPLSWPVFETANGGTTVSSNTTVFGIVWIAMGLGILSLNARLRFLALAGCWVLMTIYFFLTIFLLDLAKNIGPAPAIISLGGSSLMLCLGITIYKVLIRPDIARLYRPFEISSSDP